MTNNMERSAHRIVIADGLVTFECHAAADALCHAVYACDCEEWFESGVEDGNPWHETEMITVCASESWERTVRHYGRFDPQECMARDWIENQGELESQQYGPYGRILVPVDISWTGHGMEWRPSEKAGPSDT